MRVFLYTDAATFLGVAEPFFRSDPFSTNVIAVVSDRLAAQRDAGGGDELWAIVKTSSGEVVGVAMHTPPGETPSLTPARDSPGATSSKPWQSATSASVSNS